MGRGGKKESLAEANPEAEERSRLKKLAFSKGMISEGKKPDSATTALKPSKVVAKHNGADVMRRSQRKNRFLFSFPGLIAPLSAGGKIGELKDLSSKNPILYLHFPQGQMKLFGTIVYPKNRYLTLQFSKSGKNVMCEDYFDNMIVFSDAWWIGRKEENPEEARLELPKELHEEHKGELDFKGGAGGLGGAIEIKQSAKKSEKQVLEQESPITDIEEDFSEGQAKLEELQAVTPTRHSERTAGKKINFAEASSEDDIVGSVDTSEEEDNEEGVESPSRGYAPEKAETSFPPLNIEDEDAAVYSDFAGKAPQSDKKTTKSKEVSCTNRGTLVQTTISSLFKKVEVEKVPKKLRKTPPPEVAVKNLQHVGSRKRTNTIKDAGPPKKRKTIDEGQAGSEDIVDEQLEGSNLVETDKIYKRKTKNTASSASVNQKASQATVSKQVIATNFIQVEEDEIEDFSSTSKNSEDGEERDSDEDWAG